MYKKFYLDFLKNNLRILIRGVWKVLFETTQNDKLMISGNLSLEVQGFILNFCRFEIYFHLCYAKLMKWFIYAGLRFNNTYQGFGDI